jgi:RimJ/RimL family protein N-acetyltransferase
MKSDTSARDVLLTLKTAANSKGPKLCVPFGSPVQGLLRPLATQRTYFDPEDVRRLTEWRNRFVQAFLTEFEATKERTSNWLATVVGPSDTKILFMVDDLTGRSFGYMGLDFIDWDRHSGEADAIVRGADAPAGSMTIALQTLLAWARGQLGLERLRVRVRSDNTALQFYRKLGFHEKRRVALRRVAEKHTVRWVPDESLISDGPSLVYMELESNLDFGSRS